ncbi:MAG TPA: 2'-5' RNA ligase family protein [Variovorax sp.]
MAVAPVSAFVVCVPAAERLVADLRERFDATARLGMPAHITLLFPFMDPRQITPELLARAGAALGKVRAFAFRLRRVGRFSATAYLQPEPADSFAEMTAALVRAFPLFPPYGGEHAGVIPHLTVAHGDASEAQAAAAALEARLEASGPVQAQCNSAALIGNASGRWEEIHRFTLPLDDAPARR